MLKKLIRNSNEVKSVWLFQVLLLQDVLRADYQHSEANFKHNMNRWQITLSTLITA